MKKVKALLLVIVVTFSSVIYASADKEPSNLKLMVNEISNYLQKPEFTLKQEALAHVKIILNDNREMVVLSVVSKSYELENFIKERLNYVKLKTKIKSSSRLFTIPIRITID